MGGRYRRYSAAPAPAADDAWWVGFADSPPEPELVVYSYGRSSKGEPEIISGQSMRRGGAVERPVPVTYFIVRGKYTTCGARVSAGTYALRRRLSRLLVDPARTTHVRLSHLLVYYHTYCLLYYFCFIIEDRLVRTAG